jgi:hypothetical protein
MNKDIILLFLATTLLLTGCFKEDFSQCKREIILFFNIDIDASNQTNSSLSSEDIDQITVYLYNSNDHLVFEKTHTIEQLKANDYIVKVVIEELGNYRIVALGDTFDEDYIVTSTSEAETKTHLFSEFRVKLKHEQNIINRELGNFYISKIKDIEVDSNNSKVIDIEFVNNAKTINITTQGLTQPSTTVVRCRNSEYDLNNNTIEDADIVDYHPHKIKTANKLTLSTLRIVDGVEMPILINNTRTRTEMEVCDLVELIKLNPKYQTQQSIDREKEFDVTLIFNSETNALVKVIINNWEHEFIIPEV